MCEGDMVARKATAQDVADLAGVSRSAVSLVLNGRAKGHIAASKQQAVLEAARRLNYTPNAVALSLRSRRSRTIGVLTWPGRSGFSLPMLHATLQKATAEGYLLIFMDTANDHDQQSRAVATLHDRQVDALLVIAPDLSEYRPVEVMSATPTILVNCLAHDGGLTSIVADEYAAGSAAAQVLIDAGHRSIGVLTGSLDAMDGRLRLEGIEAAVAAQRVGISVQRAADHDIKSGFAAASALLLAPNAPTALICIHERLALGATLAAASLNIDVPTELSLVSLEDGEQLASQLVPRLTTIERPDRAMAEQAVTMTLQRFDADSESISHLSFSCSAVLRDSVVDPRRRLIRRPCRPADRR
ncbi:MAG TPA: LacI family DNA-binding transcriptional regulator [Propionibacteriaceae bacterium]|nr:LacI family DNA-binding transcriptional regulator [Propionibacteriaceae bacterium]